MQETKAFNEKRAEIYWWLSGLFSKALTQDEIHTYHSKDIRAFLTGLSENEILKPSIDQLIDSLNRLSLHDEPQLILSNDFSVLFLPTDGVIALPYASNYIEAYSDLYENPAQEMQALMSNKGIVDQNSFSEPTDHIALELDFLSNMIIHSNELEKLEHFHAALLEQKHFIEHYLLSWLPMFSQRCTERDRFGFYSSVSQLLVAFCKLDCTYLEGK